MTGWLRHLHRGVYLVGPVESPYLRFTWRQLTEEREAVAAAISRALAPR